ncbi:MAG: ZIP family metal transporter [Candidatus Marinimicrobia bacterium]|nr:ZIP family metal transporter [Candidatus Neomarinimicrobiota bacterium]
MSTLFYIIISTFSITLCVWVALLFLFIKKNVLSKIVLYLVSLSAGAMMGGAFLHLLPEALEKIEGIGIFVIVLASFSFFFLIEKFFHWRHCHKDKCSVHTFGYMNLFGDSVHNFIDGLVLAAAFIIDIKLGVVTTLAVALHEIPQEVGDFGVLIYAGFKRKTALFINYGVATSVILGGVVGYFLSLHLGGVLPYLLPFTAGGFIYIAAADLMPEIKKENSLVKSLISFGVFLVGVCLMFLLRFVA